MRLFAGFFYCLNLRILLMKAMDNVRKILIGLLFVLSALGAYGQQQIKGTIYEEVNGTKEPLPFANVFIPGTTRGVTSDFDGKYQITVYDNDTLIKVSYMGYTDVLKSFHLDQGDLIVDVTMSSGDAALQLKAVTVTAKKNMANENMLLLEQKKAVIVKESIGAKQLSNLGISNAAAATTRISGVNKTEGNGDIYIRGLGDRYLSTTMNGLPIPSDDVEKKNMDLNLFPTDVIKNVSISKTYSSERYADQTSGQVDIASKTYTDKISVSLSSGINTNVLPVYNSFKATQNYKNQTFGFYSKSSSLEESVVSQSWNTADKKAPFNYGFSITGGHLWEMESSNFTLFATLSNETKSEYREGTYTSYPSNVVKKSYTDATTYTTTYNTTGLLNLAFDRNDKWKLNYNGIWVAKTKDELYEAGRNGDGYFYEQDPSEEGSFLRDQNLKQTQIFINQLLGDYAFANNDIKWALGYNYVNAAEPNRIRNQVSMPNENNDLTQVQFSHNGGYDQRKSSQEINDNEINAFLNDQHRFIEEEEKRFNLNTGLNFRHKKRDFSADAVGAFAKGVTVTSIDNMDEALNDVSLYDDHTIKIKTRDADIYNADLMVYSAFASADFQLNDFSGNAGLRYEFDSLYVNWEVQNTTDGEVGYSYHNILPSLNLKYKLSEKNLLRFAASKTVTLPEFKELAPFEYVAPNGRITKGNPDLQSSTNYNLDVKWELYMRPKELISLTAFAKRIEDPINRTLTRGASGYYYYANTGEIAQVYGLELEGRINLINASGDNKPSLRLSFNMSKMWAEQDLLDEFYYNHKKTSGLQGAADFIANSSLIFSDHKENEFMATLSVNYSSDKIYALGAPRDNSEPDVYYDNEIIEKGFPTLDLILKKKLSPRISTKFSAKNMLNPTIEWTQDVDSSSGTKTEVVESYKKGVQLSLGITINLN